MGIIGHKSPRGALVQFLSAKYLEWWVIADRLEEFAVVAAVMALVSVQEASDCD